MKSKSSQARLILETYANINPEMVAVAVTSDNMPAGDCGSEEVEPDLSEMHMALSDLNKAAKYALALGEMLKGVESLEGWTASKITKAADYLGSVFHHLDYEMGNAEHPVEDNQ